MTETVGLPLMSPLYGPRNLPSMGKPVLGYDVRILNDNGNETPPGEIGQIAIGADPGRTVMKGYFKNPKATEETMRDGWLYTGDNAYYDEQGYFYFIDRGKDIIKRGGENVAPSEIEAAIKQINGVADVAVVGMPDEMFDEVPQAFVPQAFVIPHPGATLTEEGIMEGCRQSLTGSKSLLPTVTFCDEFPRTSVGKIQKHLLRDQALNSA